MNGSTQAPTLSGEAGEVQIGSNGMTVRGTTSLRGCTHTVLPDTGRAALHRIPSGTRDVLPDEMRELRAMTDRMREVFERAGYGEVHTPALEHEATFTQAEGPAPAAGYRTFDEHGNVLVLRSDMTAPIARVAVSRYAHAEPPLRFCYLAHAYHEVRAQRGQSREFMQAGIELIGAPAPEGTAEVIEVLCRTLDAAGLQSYRVGVGDASLFPALLGALGVGERERAPILTALVGGDFVTLERELLAVGLGEADAGLLLSLAGTRGGRDVLDGLDGDLDRAVRGLRAVHALLEPETAQRVIFDLGLARNLGYYTGAVFQVYEPAYGLPIGRGGRYDELLGKFGRPLPAVGFALNVERVHIALTGEQRGRFRRSR